jgi:hypothetical protein
MPNATFLLHKSGAQRIPVSSIVDESSRPGRESCKEKTIDGHEVNISAASLVNPKQPVSTMPTAFAKHVEPQFFAGPDNDPKPQIPPIKDPWGYKGKIFLDEDNLALNNELCNMIEGHAY